ncbi:hypothetical protein ACIBJF_30980 [Streptomyces sp. NPDC050743]|uniref:hypothetical protein n=1 Tax=Streptomyces sp. NPDC050743 TaxID=3365634 RepID=UPI0037ADB6B2
MGHRTAAPSTTADHRRTGPEALAEAMKTFEAKPSYAAYKAVILHYSHRPACADGTNPCAAGAQLTRAWKAMRWS